MVLIHQFTKLNYIFITVILALLLYLFFVNNINKNNTLYSTVNVDSRTVNVESTRTKL